MITASAYYYTEFWHFVYMQVYANVNWCIFLNFLLQTTLQHWYIKLINYLINHQPKIVCNYLLVRYSISLFIWFQGTTTIKPSGRYIHEQPRNISFHTFHRLFTIGLRAVALSVVPASICTKNGIYQRWTFHWNSGETNVGQVKLYFHLRSV